VLERDLAISGVSVRSSVRLSVRHTLVLIRANQDQGSSSFYRREAQGFVVFRG